MTASLCEIRLLVSNNCSVKPNTPVLYNVAGVKGPYKEDSDWLLTSRQPFRSELRKMDVAAPQLKLSVPSEVTAGKLSLLRA